MFIGIKERIQEKGGNYGTALMSIRKLVAAFCDKLETLNDMSCIMTIGRSLMQDVVFCVLIALELNPDEKNHFDNQRQMLQDINLARLEPAVNFIRILGNEQTHESLKRKCKLSQSYAFMYALYYVIEETCEILSTMDFNEEKLCVFMRDTVIDVSPQSSRDKRPMLIQCELDDEICMETFYGMKCTYNNGSGCCGRLHSTQEKVYSKYLTVGKVSCIRGSLCKKNFDQKNIRCSKQGVQYSLCPGHHSSDNTINKNKSAIADRWKLFSEGKISFGEIHKKTTK